MKITNGMLGKKIRKTDWGPGYFVIARYATDARVATEDDNGILKIYDNEDEICNWEFYTEPVEEKKPSERFAFLEIGSLKPARSTGNDVVLEDYAKYTDQRIFTLLK